MISSRNCLLVIRKLSCYSRRIFLSLIIISFGSVIWHNIKSSGIWRTSKMTTQCSITVEQSNSTKCGNCQASIPFHQFDPNQPTSVVLLAYQRSGSTFSANLFNLNPSIFHAFEPLDSLYASMYGMKPTWTVPSDIVTYWNGQPREIPENEIREQSKFLENLLTCSFDQMPTDFLVHIFLMIPSYCPASSDYTYCLRESYTLQRFYACERLNPFHCGERLGNKSESELAVCKGLLANETYEPVSVPISTRDKYNKYRKCMKDLREIVDKNCTSLLRTICNRSKIRSTKTCRATMASMEALLERLPNFRVIHLIRDPRAVVPSRIISGTKFLAKISSLQNVSSSFTTEAEIYCRTAVKDIRIRQRLEQLYPGRIYPIIYEEMVKNFEQTAENVYHFLDTAMSRELTGWLKEKNYTRGYNSANEIPKWARTLTVEQNNNIVKVCAEFFDLVDYKWYT